MTGRDRLDEAALPFDFDALALLLGGGEVAELGDLAPPACRAVLQRPGQWLFAAEPVRWLHEVLLQKVAAFRAVVAEVAAVHRAGRPHLALAPGCIRGAFPGRGTAPVRWQLELQLGDRELAESVDAGERAPLWQPAAAVRGDLRRRAFLPPSVQGGDAPTLAMRVACSRHPAPDGAQQLRLEATGTGVPRCYRAGDVVFVQLDAAGPRLPMRLEEVRARGLSASAVLPDEHPCWAWTATSAMAELEFLPRLGPAADCHALGLLLVRWLLAHDERSGDEAAEAFGKLLRRLDDEPSAVRVVEATWLQRLRQLAAGREFRTVCEPVAALHRAADRTAVAAAIHAAAEPPDLGAWLQLLGIAARLLGTPPPFAYATTAGPAGADPLARVLADLDVVQRRLHAAVFLAPERERVLRRVLAATALRVDAEQRAAAADGAGQGGVHRRPGSDGFRLRIQKDGEAHVDERRFAVERLTIGRREADNLLRLNDPMVSSAHAVIERTAEGWVVLDRNSTNGTEVDGIRLPVEVPQPLDDGSVVCIRPFRLTFVPARARHDATLVAPAGDAADLLELAYAAFAEAAPGEAEAAVAAVFDEAQEELGSGALLARLAELQRRLAGEADGGGAAAVAAAAARALAQLSRSLLGAGEFRSPDDVQCFAQKLARFVESTSQWIERTLELRKALGRHLDLGFVSTQSGRPPVRSAADVRSSALGWLDPGDASEPSPYFLARYYDELLTVLEGLLRGNQQIRRAVRERLDPARLVEAAGREAKLKMLVQAAAGSALWKAYVAAFQEVTASADGEAELDELLRKALPPRAMPGE